MKIEIEYCGAWNYEPRAREAREIILHAKPSAEVSLRRSGGGAFEVRVDGRLAYSKLATCRFPSDDELLRAIGW